MNTNFVYNYPTKGDYEFNLFPNIVIGRDIVSDGYSNRHSYIGVCWLFWAVYYYYK